MTQLPTEAQFTQLVAKRWMNDQEDTISMVVAFVPKFNQVDDFEIKSSLSEHLARNRVAQLVGYIGNNHFCCVFRVRKKTDSPNQVRVIHQIIRKFFSLLNQSAGKVIHKAILRGKVGVSVLGHDTYNPKLFGEPRGASFT
ncbi:hypothetical protein QW180_16905 [Vibrio sinaloensis]|nr:hypothetical protein [Vibrio sinaloensis]